MKRTLVLAVTLSVSAATSVSAQEAQAPASRRIAFDSVVGSQDFFRESSDWQTIYLIEAVGTVQIRRGWQVSFRPVAERIRGEWDFDLYQASVRRDVRFGANWRIEAGRLASTVGLGMTEHRANVNGGVLWWHRPYYMPMPAMGEDLPRVSLISATYPIGTQVSASRDKWDARAALLDRGPVEFWQGWEGSSRGPNGVVGFGVTPRQGLRLGIASAWGRYARATADRPAQRYVLVNVEGEFAFGHTQIGGEWTRDRFETPAGHRAASGLTAQVQHTLTPRIFAHSRATFIRAPEAVEPLEPALQRTFRSIENTVGYRVTPQVTVRLAHAALRSFSASSLDNQLGVSIIWARRWW
jgi:hypothetical protein